MSNVERYSDNMVFGFVKDILAKSGTNEKKKIIVSYYNSFGDEFVEFLNDAYSPFVVTNINTAVTSNYKKLADNSKMFMFKGLSYLFKYLKEFDSANNEIVTVVASFIKSYEYCSFEQGVVIDMILKNLRLGVNIDSINKTLSFNAISCFDVQLCKPYSESKKDKLIENKVSTCYYVEPKLDGVRILATVESNRVTLRTRKGHIVNGYKEIEELLMNSKFVGYTLDGELQKENDFDNTMNDLFSNSQDKKAKFNVFDIIKNEELDQRVCKTPLVLRKELLDEAFINTRGYWLFKKLKDDVVVKVRADVYQGSFVYEKIYNLLDANIDAGFEGIVIKRANSLYEFKRTSDWFKVKKFETLDLKIIDIEEGSGRLEGLMGNIVVMYKGKEVRVGTGFDDNARRDMLDFKLDYIGAVAEIAYQEVTADGSLRFPSFKRIRYDK